MKSFKNILVGIDLSQGDKFVSDELPAPTEEAVDRALWLAKLNSAKVAFLFMLDVSQAAQRLIEEQTGEDRSVLDEARTVLKSLAARAASEGVHASTQVQLGKSWLGIIQHVLRNHHDLVVAGTRHLGAAKNLLLGSTGMKLLRKCPCPVWITQPQPNQDINSILVAHDLRPVGDLAMELGCCMAQLHGARLQVLHSLEFAELESMFPERVSADQVAQCRSQAQKHIDAQLRGYEFHVEPQVHILSEPPECAILEFIEKYHVNLLTMGTIARTGVSGLITGNTAERLLPQIPCSVLAVKPPGFVSPVTL